MLCVYHTIVQAGLISCKYTTLRVIPSRKHGENTLSLQSQKPIGVAITLYQSIPLKPAREESRSKTHFQLFLTYNSSTHLLYLRGSRPRRCVLDAPASPDNYYSQVCEMILTRGERFMAPCLLRILLLFHRRGVVYLLACLLTCWKRPNDKNPQISQGMS